MHGGVIYTTARGGSQSPSLEGGRQRPVLEGGYPAGPRGPFRPNRFRPTSSALQPLCNRTIPSPTAFCIASPRA